MVMDKSPIAGEKYVSVAVLAEEWNLSEPMIRVLFKNESKGVMRAPSHEGAKPRVAFIAESAIGRIWDRHGRAS